MLCCFDILGLKLVAMNTAHFGGKVRVRNKKGIMYSLVSRNFT